MSASTDPSSTDALIGTVLADRYRLDELLGEGGMGKVYAAEHVLMRKRLAIKVLHQELCTMDEVVARFQREAMATANIDHPNIAAATDCGKLPDGVLFLVLELVQGKCLRDELAAGPMPVQRALRIAHQIASALAAAHALGIVHRDLKPENVMLVTRGTEQDFVKVLDFGIAARTESSDAQKEQKLTQQGMVLGTPPYMSPEQFTGKQLDARSDVYSLGVMAYEMLTGRLPFDADTPWQWATQHMTAQPIPFEVSAPSSAVPPGMRQAILRALSKDREERQESTKHFFEELSGGGGITVVDAEPVSLQRAGTAAMAAAPDFGAFDAGAPAAAAPAVVAAPPPNPPGMAAPVPPPPPPPRGGSGGGKGLIIGLGAVGALLVIGIVVVAAQKMKPVEDDQPLTNPFTSADTATTIAPELDAATASTATGEATQDAAAPQPDKTATPQPTTTKTTTASTGTGGTGKPPAGKACDNCIAAAQGGNIQGAAANYARCSDPGKKAQCQARAKASAPAAAKRAALNGNCAQAKGIINAANAMGAGSGALSGALAGTSCK